MMNKEPKGRHTPGPWHIVHEPSLSTYHIRVEDLDAAPVASLFYSSGGSRPQLARELIDANARLIAAAPDLLLIARAYIELAEFIDASGFDFVDWLHEQMPALADSLDNARKVIAHAEGGAA